MRVENPREFAEMLLGWDRGKGRQNDRERQSQRVKVKADITVHLTYFTAWPDQTGKIDYYNDMYGRDQRMEKALSASRWPSARA